MALGLHGLNSLPAHEHVEEESRTAGDSATTPGQPLVGPSVKDRTQKLNFVIGSPVSRLSWSSCLSSAQPQTRSFCQCLQTPAQSTPGSLLSATAQVMLSVN